MGWNIKHEPDKGYQLWSTITGQMIHEEQWLNEYQVKQVMAETALLDFYEQLIRIDMDFLNKYRVNGELNHTTEFKAIRWMIDNNDKIEDEAKTILKKLLDIDLK